MEDAAAVASLPELGKREDLRAIPLVTIDGEEYVATNTQNGTIYKLDSDGEILEDAKENESNLSNQPRQSNH